MRKFLAALCCYLLVASSAFAQVGFGGVFPGPGTVHSAGGGGYSGQGDLKSYDVWYGVYAYSAAKRGTAAVNVCYSGVCGDLSTDASTGLLVTSTNINGAPCDDSGHICKINTWYNQGAGGSTYDLTQSTDASRATLLISCTGISGPCATSTAAIYESSSNYTASQPFSITAVANRNTSTSAATGIIASAGGAVLESGFFNANDDFFCTAGAIVRSTSVTDGTWYGRACNFNGASSNLYINTTQTTGDVSTNTLSGHISLLWNVYNVGRNWQGKFASAGIAPSNFNTSELSGANSASKTILGY